jgi:hypothetical protein
MLCNVVCLYPYSEYSEYRALVLYYYISNTTPSTTTDYAAVTTKQIIDNHWWITIITVSYQQLIVIGMIGAHKIPPGRFQRSHFTDLEKSCFQRKSYDTLS